MLTVTVNLNAAGAMHGIAAVMQCMEHPTEINRNMAGAVETMVRDHLLGLNSRSPHTSFYARAARSTEVSADDSGAMVRVTHRGIALRYYGGHVVPITPGVKNLALPTEHVPVLGGEERARPMEMGILAYIPKRDGGPTTGYFVEGEGITGKRSHKERIVPKKGGHLLFVLRSWTDHDEDQSVLPAILEMQQAATAAAAAVIEVRSAHQGPA